MYVPKELINLLIIMVSLGTMFAQNKTTDNYSIWKPEVEYYVEDLGQSRIVPENLRVEVDFSIVMDQENMTTLLEQMRRMCRETIKIVQITHCDALLKHLRFKYEDIFGKINEVL